MAKQPEQPKLVTRKHIARQEKEQRQIRIIRTVGGVVLLAVVILVIYSIINQLYILPNRAVAHVGNTKISSRQFETEVKYSRMTTLNQAASYAEYGQMFGSMGSNFMQTAKTIIDELNNPTNFGKGILDRMVDDILVKEEAAKLGLSVSDEELKSEMQRLFGFYPDGTPVPSNTPTAFATPTISGTQLAIIKATETSTPVPTQDPTVQAATETAVASEITATAEAMPTATAPAETPTTAAPTAVPSITPTPTVFTTQVYAKEVDNYRVMLKQYDIKFQDLEEMIRTQLLRDKLQAELTKDMKPMQEQVWVRHIIVNTEEEGKKALQEIKDGKDFAEVAKTYSTDGTKDNGGDLGWMGMEDQNWDKDFLTAAFTLTRPGQVSDLIKTQFGYHIIQLVDRAENNVDSTKFEEMKFAKLTNFLKEIKDSRPDITIESNWADFVPLTPAVPQELERMINLALTSQ